MYSLAAIENVKVQNQEFGKDLVANWLQYNSDKSASTVKTYSKAVKSFFQFLQEREINPCRESVVEFRNWLCAEKSLATARLYVTATKIFSKWLSARGLFKDFAENVRSPRLDEQGEVHQREAVKLREVKAALNLFKGAAEKDLRDEIAFRLMATLGLRTIEVSRLDCGDVEKRGGKFFVKIWGKGRAGKTAPLELPTEIYALIDKYLSTRKSARLSKEPLLVATSRRNKGARLQPQVFSRLAKRIFRQIGIDSKLIVAHSLRHFCATQLLLSSVDIRRVQKIMRHKSLEVTLRYAHDLELVNHYDIQNLADLIESH